MASETSLCNRNVKYHPGAQRGPDAEDVPFTGILLLNWPAVMLVQGTIIMFTPTLQNPEGFRVKAPEGEVVVFSFELSATQNLKFSGFPAG